VGTHFGGFWCLMGIATKMSKHGHFKKINSKTPHLKYLNGVFFFNYDKNLVYHSTLKNGFFSPKNLAKIFKFTLRFFLKSSLFFFLFSFFEKMKKTIQKEKTTLTPTQLRL
jgi:hypothetical protein